MNLRAFLQWWLAHLAEWVPARLRHRVSERRDTFGIDLTRDAAKLHATIDGSHYALDEPLRFDNPEHQHTALRAFLADLPHRPRQVEIRLAPGQYLRRDLELPLAAEATLSDAIGFQIDRLTPFSPDEVVYRCGVAERDPANKRLRAWLAVTPATAVNQVLAWFDGERPKPVSSGKEGPVEGSPLVLRYDLKGNRGPSKAGLLLAVNLALLMAALTLHWRNGQTELQALENAVSEVRREAAEAADLADNIARLRTEAIAMRERRTQQPLLVEVLEDLTKRLADDTHLQRFEVREGQLRLYGISAAASDLIGQLEASPLLADVRFEASITRDASTGGERFSITARLTPRESAMPQTAEVGS